MSIKLMTKVWDSRYAKTSPDGNPSHAKLLVMLKLADHANDDGECWPAQARIAFACNISRSSVNEIIKTLEIDGKLTITARPGTSSKYQLHFDALDMAPKCTEVHGDAPSDRGVPSEDTLRKVSEVSPQRTPGVPSEDTNHQRIVSEDSVPNGTGGKPAGPFQISATKPLGPFPDLSTTPPSTDPLPQTPQPPDLVSNPYAPAVAYFAGFGYAEKGTRSMIGAAVRDYGKEAVADILADVISRPDVAEPKAYFQKALQEHRLKNPVLPTLAEAAQQAARYLTVRSLPNGNPIAAV